VRHQDGHRGDGEPGDDQQDEDVATAVAHGRCINVTWRG
jgi:hypothetical protein